MVSLSSLLTNLFTRTTGWLGRKPPSDLSLTALCEELLSNKSEVTGLSLAQELLDRFENLDIGGQKDFFTTLAIDFDLDIPALKAALKDYEAEKNKASSYPALIKAATSRRQMLFKKLNELPGATQHLVNMRKTLLSLLPEHPELHVIDQDLKQLFTSWFNRGFLVLQPINWSSSAHILEKIIAYEAVHAIESWDDLRRRLQPGDRRCFAFFHPAMPDEPLIFVEIALGHEIPDSIQAILAHKPSESEGNLPTTATFYSISNCQVGLTGISFGNSLIKTVVSELRREFESLTQFVTLSPLPQFASWLAKQPVDKADIQDDEKVTTLAARYLIHEKTQDGMPFDPVARFHLGNGARIHALHANADTSTNGKAISHAVMANYLYDLKQLEANHQKFVTNGEIACSGKVKDQANKASAQLQATNETQNPKPSVPALPV